MVVGFEPTTEMTIDAITGDNGLMIPSYSQIQRGINM